MQLRTALFDRISGVDLLSPRPEIAASALIALRAFADPRTAPRIAQLLRTGSASLRSAALLALGDFELKDTRRLLRSALQNESPRNLLNAAIALAEVGTEHDAAALARVAEQGTWPLPAAAAYAVAHIAQSDGRHHLLKFRGSGRGVLNHFARIIGGVKLHDAEPQLRKFR